MKNGRNRLVYWSSILGVVAVVLAITILPGCSSCSQDFLPATQETINGNTYHIGYVSTNPSIESVRWENITTGESGTATIHNDGHCFAFIGCIGGSHVEMDIPLAPGLNTIFTYRSHDGCEFREDFLITSN